MKKLRKSIFTPMLILALLLSNISIVSAAETPTAATYDMEKGGTQTFHLEDTDGQEIIITVEELSSTSRISNGSYKVTYEYLNMWEAGFIVSISSNKITEAHSPFYKVVSGSISGPTLRLNSPQKATYKFVYKWGIFSSSTGVAATISGSSLEVTKL